MAAGLARYRAIRFARPACAMTVYFVAAPSMAAAAGMRGRVVMDFPARA